MNIPRTAATDSSGAKPQKKAAGQWDNSALQSIPDSPATLSTFSEIQGCTLPFHLLPYPRKSSWFPAQVSSFAHPSYPPLCLSVSLTLYLYVCAHVSVWFANQCSILPPRKMGETRMILPINNRSLTCCGLAHDDNSHLLHTCPWVGGHEEPASSFFQHFLYSLVCWLFLHAVTSRHSSRHCVHPCNIKNSKPDISVLNKQGLFFLHNVQM